MAQFVDQVMLHLTAGDGGNGCVSVRREKFKPLAGPDGGNGGDGGSIVLVADPQETTLLTLRFAPHQRALGGGAGAGDLRHGAKGADTELAVPIGTVVKDESGALLADLDEPGMRYVVAPGGQGGLGNAALATAKRKAPGFALKGTPGWAGEVSLELKTVADVALVGFPSAGKSSLIAALSAAKPKIADYPFTTLHPNLGVVEAGGTRYTIADVPGLIEGAADGKGLGLEFLRHVERCSALVHVLDCATLEPGRDPLTDLAVIRVELAAYPVPDGQLPLLERPAVVALNKVDVPEAADLAALVTPDLEAAGYRVFPVSAVSRVGLRELSYALAGLVDADRAARAAEAEAKPRIVLRPKAVDAKDFEVKSEGGTTPLFRVLGAKPERWVAQTDFDNDEAVGYLADRLAKLGVEEALFEAGATPGATVKIGRGAREVTFDWEPTLTSAAELIQSPRGTDARVDGGSGRRTTKERQAEYHALMDARAAARAELDAARADGARGEAGGDGEAGYWSDDD